MLKKFLLGAATLLIGFVFVFSLAGCGSESNISNSATGDAVPGPREKIDEGSGWPSAKLQDYNNPAWAQPAGLDGISWDEWKAGSGAIVTYYLDIKFTSATTATKNSIDDYFGSWASNTNWVKTDPDDFAVSYTVVAGSYHYGVIISCNISTGGYITITRMSGYNPLA
jgi:hypothetical protein